MRETEQLGSLLSTKRTLDAEDRVEGIGHVAGFPHVPLSRAHAIRDCMHEGPSMAHPGTGQRLIQSAGLIPACDSQAAGYIITPVGKYR